MSYFKHPPCANCGQWDSRWPLSLMTNLENKKIQEQWPFFLFFLSKSFTSVTFLVELLSPITMATIKPKTGYGPPIVSFDVFTNDPLISLVNMPDREKLAAATVATNATFWQKIVIDHRFFDKNEAEVNGKLSRLFAHAYLHFHTGSEEDWIKSIEDGRKPYLISHILNTLEPASLNTTIPRYYVPFDGKFFHKVNPHAQYVWLDGYDRNINHLIGSNWVEGEVVISNTNLQYVILDLDRFAEEWRLCPELPDLSENQKRELDLNLPTGNDLYSLSSAMNGLVRNTTCATTRYALYRVQLLFNAFAKLVSSQTQPNFKCAIRGKMGLVSSFSWSLERENASNRIHVTEITGA
jgi:hypothetical protein